MLRPTKTTRTGITFVELLVVVAVVAALVAMAIPAVQKARAAAIRAEKLNWRHQRKLGDAPPRSLPLRILFIGNSYTGTNDLPAAFASLAKSAQANPEVVVETHLVGGATLLRHWDEGVAVEKIRAGDWDFVVLQEQSQTPLPHFGRDNLFHPYSRLFAKEIRDVDAIPLFFMTWARPDTPGPQSLWTNSYAGIAKELAAECAPAGMAFERVLMSLPKVPLHADAGGHPTRAGTYLAACAFYAAVYRRSPEGLTNRIETPGGAIEVSPADAAEMQRAAWTSLREIDRRIKPFWRAHAMTLPSPIVRNLHIFTGDAERVWERVAPMADAVSWPGDLDTLRRVGDRLRAGGIVGVTTEAGFDAIAFGLDPRAVDRLHSLASSNAFPAILLSSAMEVFDWLPHLRGAGVRLARDFWPGSFVLVSSLGMHHGLMQRLPESVRGRLLRPEGLPVRVTPRDDLVPLLIALGGPAAIAPLSEAAAREVDLVLDVDPIAPTSPITAAAADERSVRVLIEGASRRDEIESSGRNRVVFVCTGNTCRSPLAEVLCRRLLADTLEIDVGELASRGFEVASAGLAAAVGEPASPEAIAVARSQGADLAPHASRPLTMELVDRADHLFTMTAGHLRMLQSLRLPVGPDPQLLSAWGEDVPDPIGGPMELYEACAEQIRKCLRERLPQILEG